MKATMLYGPKDVRFEERPDPVIMQPTDAIIRVSVACVCGSDLWPYRGAQPINGPTPMGHEYCGIVEDVGREVRTTTRGQFVVGSFATSDNTCPHCRHGYQSSCVQREFMSEAQAPLLRVPLADGTLVATNEVPSDDLLPSIFILCMIVQLTMAQKRSVSGVIREKSTNETLPGVSVLEKGTKNGTITNVDGKYEISVNEGATLVVSYIGLKTQEVKVGNTSTINVTLPKGKRSSMSRMTSASLSGIPCRISGHMSGFSSMASTTTRASAWIVGPASASARGKSSRSIQNGN